MFKDFNDSITVNMDSVNSTKKTSWKTFGKYETMNILHGAITLIKIAGVFLILHFIHFKLWRFIF